LEIENKIPTLEEIKQMVYDLDENIKGSHQAFKYAVVFAAGMYLDHDLKVLCEFTGYSYRIVGEAKKNLEKNKIWVDNKVCCEHFFDEDADPLHRLIDFWLCVSVAEGKIVRVEAPLSKEEREKELAGKIERLLNEKCDKALEGDETVGEVKFYCGHMVINNEIKKI
jgi:hypothetical protein